eukprot:UN10220
MKNTSFFYDHDTNQRYVTESFVKFMSEFYGHPTLDPFSCFSANAQIRANRIYGTNANKDGFTVPWDGNTVWVNPPFFPSDAQFKFVGKTLYELNRKRDYHYEILAMHLLNIGHSDMEALKTKCWT